MATPHEQRVNAAAARWVKAYHDTLRIRRETHPRETAEHAAWEMMRLLMGEIHDRDVRIEFVWRVVNNTD